MPKLDTSERETDELTTSGRICMIPHGSFSKSCHAAMAGISCSSHSCPPLVEWLHPTRDEEIQRISYNGGCFSICFVVF